MRQKWSAGAAIVITLVAMGASPAAASSQSSKVTSEWKAADGAFAKADAKFSAVLNSSRPSLSGLRKAGATFGNALGSFDSALSKIKFTGKTASDVSAVIALQKQEAKVVSNIKSIKSFESGFAPLTPKFFHLQTALGKDLGIPWAEIYI